MINSIDLFAGCGGLLDGFEQSRKYNMLSAIEWEKAPCDNLRRRLETKWGVKDADKRVLQFDIQRTEDLFLGWHDDPIYGSSAGLDSLINGHGLDVIIGGPPCQAYSIAGRVRDENGMRDDYRNYLFESYLEVVKRYKPKAFIFENVPGILTARPGDGTERIINLIQRDFHAAGYEVLQDLSRAVIDMTEYGVPQNRKRIIILGLSQECYGERSHQLLEAFYCNVLPKYKQDKKTVRDAIADLPKLYPADEDLRFEGRRTSHTLPDPFVANHVSRWNSKRDIAIFRMLEEDIERGENKYATTESLKKLYTEVTGKTSNVHKYHVIKWDEQSNLIPAHLYKDGLRHIHPDSKQARTITVREAARLQTFDDDYVFYGSNTETYKMIGNAVPPRFAKCLANALSELLFE